MRKELPHVLRKALKEPAEELIFKNVFGELFTLHREARKSVLSTY